MQCAGLFISMMLLCSCKVTEPKIDSCYINSIERKTVWCFPLNQEKPEYERPLIKGDMVLSIDDYGKSEKHHEDLHRYIRKK